MDYNIYKLGGHISINWFLCEPSILVKLEFVKPGEKTLSKVKTNSNINPLESTRAKLVEGKRSQHCAIPAPPKLTDSR